MKSFSQIGSGGVRRLRIAAAEAEHRILGSHDYRAPSLAPLPPDFESFFPLIVRRRSLNPCVRHTGRYDRRYPGVGVLTLDETTILFNYGLALKNATLIEIGCWVGWSTAAWAFSGVHIVAIDPVLNGYRRGRVVVLRSQRQERWRGQISSVTTHTRLWRGSQARDSGLVASLSTAIITERRLCGTPWIPKPSPLTTA
jgi:hypothetical protein